MKKLFLLATLGSACCLSMGTLVGCHSESEPGATYALNTYTGMVDAAPDSATTAAAKACGDLGLLDVVETSTKVDGKVTAKTADDKTVTISVGLAGDGVSKLSIQVGTTGDESMSAQLFERTKAHLRWF